MDIKITINGVDYTLDEAKELYNQLSELCKRYDPPRIYPDNVKEMHPMDTGIIWKSGFSHTGVE